MAITGLTKSCSSGGSGFTESSISCIYWWIYWFGTNYTKKYVELWLMAVAKKLGVAPKESCDLKNEEDSKND